MSAPRLVAPLDGGVLGCPGRALAQKKHSEVEALVNPILGWNPVDVWGKTGADVDADCFLISFCCSKRNNVL